MLDFPNRILAILIAFVIFVVGPLLYAYQRQDMIMHREVLNEAQSFLSQVADSDKITQQEVNNLYIGVNASGGTFDVKVKRFIPTPLPTTVGNSRLLYTRVPYQDSNGDAISMNKGDLVKVTVTPVGISPIVSIMWMTLGLEQDTRPLSLVKSVQ